MKSNNRIDKTGDDHAGIAELIPWYVKGTLSPGERQTVDRHLENCQRCRQTLAECETLAHTPVPIQAEWQPSSAHFNRLLAALDELEAVEKVESVASINAVPQKQAIKAGIAQRLKGYFSQTPAWMQWTLAVETLAIAGLISFLVIPHVPGLSSNQNFETLSNAEPANRQVANVVRVVFSAEMSVKDMSEVLQAAKAQIRQGPSAVGAFTLEVEKDQVPQALATLRAGKGVRLVLLLDQTSSE